MSFDTELHHFFRPAVRRPPAIPPLGVRPNELARTMIPHPLMYQELAHNPEYTLYNGRLTPAFLDHATADEMYWKVRREVILRHTGELPLEIVGPDAEACCSSGCSHVMCRRCESGAAATSSRVITTAE